MAKSDVDTSSALVVDLAEKEFIQVLHVDDEPSLLKAAKQILELQGNFQVKTASSVEEAVEKMKQEAYDVIVCDYEMPERDGLDFLKELRHDGNLVPFIIFTGKGREEVAVEALNLGADGYFNKFGGVEAVYTELAHGIHQVVERKEAEERLRESEERFRNLYESIPDAVAVYVGREGRLIEYNEALKKRLGYTDEELKDKTFLDFVHPDDHAMIIDKYTTKYPDEAFPLVYEIKGINKKGEILPTEISVGTYKKKGRVIGIEVLHRDITERKCFEERLSALNVYGRSLNVAGSMVEVYGLTLDVMEKTLGFEHAFFMVVDDSMLSVVDQRGYPQDISIKLPLDGSKRGVSVKVANTGESINVADAGKEDAWVEFSPGIRSGLDVPVKFRGKVLGVIGVDSKILNAFTEKDQKLLEILAAHAATAISNLQRAEKLKTNAQILRESQDKFERLFMDNPEAAVYMDSGFRILEVNPRFQRLFGYSLGEIRGKYINDIIVPEDKMEEAERFDRKASKGITYHEGTVRKRKDGTLIPVSLSAAPITIEDKVVGHMAIYKDISQLKNTEKELKETLEELTALNEKLHVVGRITRYDARNKLSTVNGNIFLANQILNADNEALEYLCEVESACKQVGKIFDFARTYEKLGVEELIHIDVEKSLKEAVMMFSNLHGVRVVNDCYGLTVLADSLLRQLFYNLMDNSVKHGEKVSSIRVYYEEDGKDQLKIVCEDDGIGIPKVEKEKIFMEGFGKGTGYGLYLIRKMCGVYGWRIQETGKHGEGARFTITIPKVGKNGKTNYQLC